MTLKKSVREEAEDLVDLAVWNCIRCFIVADAQTRDIELSVYRPVRDSTRDTVCVALHNCVFTKFYNEH